ncbi:discoidin domain-containing protein [uncultured Hymenobacter sp.]|uniref:galactose-binding domain-containing protein n=1 Tax=uncultured Hymenobacter sp. TaxID=170016 RepID=UPI0035CABEF6
MSTSTNFLYRTNKLVSSLRTLPLLLAVALLLGPTAAWAQCEKLTWQDEFSGPNIDLSKWELETPRNQGTGQLDLPTTRPENAKIVDGKLVLTIRKEEYEGFHYTSARLRTYKKLDFQYGRVEARVKGVDTQGNGFAFWMLGSDFESVTWPKCGEVDIFENTGRTPGRNIGTAHFAGPEGRDAISQGAVELPAGQKWADDFHVAGIEWSPTYIKWYIDDPSKPYHVLDLTNPINGYRPFNRPFFLLLSVGMGGSYSGDPDATTVTPMSATIDWVHVYKGAYSTFVSGDDKVYQGEQNKQYTVSTTDDGTYKYNWTVPAGATIVSGQGTPTVTVDWGQTGGLVSTQVSSSCSTNNYSLNVVTEAPFVADKVFENFEAPPAFNYVNVSGTLSKGVPNPLVNSINPSPKVGKYIRNDGALYDVIGMLGVNAAPAGDFAIGKRRILLDVYTNAAPGTHVSLNFENSKAARADNYPTGRYANFDAVTTRRGQWETLEFSYTGSPDGGTGASNVDQWILLFAPVTNTGNVFYFDNLRTGQPGGPPRVLDTRVLQNFDGNDQLTKDFANGQYAVQANPAAGSVNSSATVAKYVRDSGALYDALVYKTLAIADGRPFRLGTSTVSMDVYSDAPVGTKLSLNFEISSIAQAGNYPNGRYANFEAVTMKQNQWETVTFSLSSVPDRGASDAAVDKLVFLFNPVTNTTNTYYFDNIRLNSTAPKESLVLANVLEDYDANDLLTANAATTGAYSPKVANPTPGGSNTSANVAKYVRSATAQYDLLYFNRNAAPLNAGALKNRQQKFALDVYTDAPAGTPVLMGLDASTLLGTSENSGKHSNYLGTTTVQGAWHTVYFTFGSQPDNGVPDNLVDRVAVLFELGKFTGTTYYIDNLRTVNVVQQPTLTSLALTPALSQNVGVGQKVQFAAQGKDQFGANLAAGTITWAVSGGGSIDANGLFTAAANGAFKVTATASGVTSTADVLVGQSIALTTVKVDPISTFIYQGTSLPLTARGTDQTGQPFAFTPTWTSSGGTGISVSATGVVSASATAAGTATVVASGGGKSSTATIQVRATPVADSIAVGPAQVKVAQGDALTFFAKTFDQYRNPFPTPLTWSVSGGGNIDAASGVFTSTTIGTFVVKVQAGSVVASTSVSVVPKPTNLALNKPTRASSGRGNLAPFYATDGTSVRVSPDTRWGSAELNGEWLRVDLGQQYDLSRVVLYWENAYGKAYRIEAADDTLQARRVLYTETAGNGNTDDLPLPAGASGRYVWMQGVERGSPYGYSLYEIQVFGLTHQDPALKSIVVTPNFSKVAAGQRVTFKATSLDQFGNPYPTTPTWTASGGTISSAGVFTASATGTYTITATAGGVSGSASLTVQAAAATPVLTSLTVTPATASVVSGASQQFTAQGKDQFGNAFATTPTWTVSGGGTISSGGLFAASTVGGPFTVTATSGSVKGTASVTVTAPTTTVGPNLALKKPVRVSSLENGQQFPGSAAVDGNGGTRWASARADAQWLRVDLGASYTVNRVKLTWEGAYGKDYNVEISADTTNWKPLKAVTGNSVLVNDWTGLAGTGRYLRLNLKARGTGWGYSLYELEVYGAAATSAKGALAAQSTAGPAGTALGVFPNPVTSTATLTGIAAYPATVGVYDGQGRLVQQAQLKQPADAGRLDLSGLAKGIYLLRATSAGAVQTQRFVKE